MRITACDMSRWLSEAKEAHTRYEERFRLEGVPVPEHNWQDWYSRFIIQRIKDREYNEFFETNVETAVPFHAKEREAE